MLTRLIIKNYALIKDLELQPSPALNVITGETGAGKSIMLGAVGLLLGNRADTKVLLNANEKCVAEAEFNIKPYHLQTLFADEDLDYDDTLIIRREININGKSRAFINDTPVTLDVLKSIGALLMDIHSQHETLQLSKQVYQLKLIDAFAHTTTQLDAYQKAWKDFLQSKSAYETLLAQSEKIKAEADFIRFQFEELDKANLQNGEQESIEKELKIAENAEEIKIKLNQALALLGQEEFSVLSGIATLKSILQNLSGYAANYSNLFTRMESVLIELDDLQHEIAKEESQVEFNENKTNELRERLSLIYQLLKKHRLNESSQLIDLHEELGKKNELADNLDDSLQQALHTMKTSEQVLMQKAELLSKARQSVFKEISKKIIALLKELGMPEATFDVQHHIEAPSAKGIDKVDFTFSANKGIAAMPMAAVASGGEFSRLMFSIKYVLAEKTALPTLIFDEIDNGVSGEIAIKLGRMMKDMADRHQVISISHLPQIAAKATAHYFVYKDSSDSKTVSRLRLLKESERVEEIAKMIAGDQPSAAAIKNAKELILS
jgi:DNA repair protein RecN (Recombination protein N)